MLRRGAQRGQQRRRVAAAVEGPHRVGIDRHAEQHRHRPAGFGQLQRVADQARPHAGAARHRHLLERAGALQHQRPRLRAAAHGVEVRERGVDQVGRDPAARPLAGHGLLQQHQAELVEVGFEVGVGIGQVVGRLHHLRQVVQRMADAGELLLPDVRRQAFGVAGDG